MTALVGDIGGTNTRLALAQDGHLLGNSMRVMANRDHADFSSMLTGYLRALDLSSVSAVCLGAAGPVQDGAVQLTNAPWRIESAAVTALTGASNTILLNDLQAMAHALHGLGGQDQHTILAGAKNVPTAAPRLIVAPGTGINAAVAHMTRTGVFVPPSESGHVALSAHDSIDLAFCDFARAELGHCPVEAALCGPGLERLYRFFGGKDAAKAPAILGNFETGQDLAATRAVDLFGRYLGRYCADLSLIHLPFGGIFLAGGVGRAIASILHRTGFATSFHRGGPYASIHKSITISEVTVPQLALLGCAQRLMQS
ncbi:glucokinase [Thalassovita taeanensis]|uniref:Glucokinase n=1 Tax=Thalassovita taeanensis TaxID=657014 RepID=A0A1H9JCB8_9RHOB|nr:glucokinase [Thalassovita taeanensis]SEQ84486.1 glucokinase [Thalassovita taeanensis]